MGAAIIGLAPDPTGPAAGVAAGAASAVTGTAAAAGWAAGSGVSGCAVACMPGNVAGLPAGPGAPIPVWSPDEKAPSALGIACGTVDAGDDATDAGEVMPGDVRPEPSELSGFDGSDGGCMPDPAEEADDGIVDAMLPALLIGDVDAGGVVDAGGPVTSGVCFPTLIAAGSSGAGLPPSSGACLPVFLSFESGFLPSSDVCLPSCPGGVSGGVNFPDRA